MAKYLALVLLVACGSKEAPPPDPQLITTARLGASRLALESYPLWAAKHADKACPDKLADLEGGADNDPWGHPYKMLCGKDAPPGALGFGALSFGPDGKEGTPDDIKSWEK